MHEVRALRFPVLKLRYFPTHIGNTSSSNQYFMLLSANTMCLYNVCSTIFAKTFSIKLHVK